VPFFAGHNDETVVSQCSYGPGYTDVDGWSRNKISALCNVVERRRRTDVVDTMRVRGLLAAVVVLVRSLADVVRSARSPYDALTTPVNLTAVRDPVHFLPRDAMHPRY